MAYHAHTHRMRNPRHTHNAHTYIHHETKVAELFFSFFLYCRYYLSLHAMHTCMYCIININMHTVYKGIYINIILLYRYYIMNIFFTLYKKSENNV